MVGIPGVGKTTLVKKLVELLQAKKHSVRVESFGTLMLKEAADYVKNRDDLRRLDILQQKKLQNKVASKIASFDEDIVLVDTHAFIATDSGFYPGLPNNILEIINILANLFCDPQSQLALRRYTQAYWITRSPQ